MRPVTDSPVLGFLHEFLGNKSDKLAEKVHDIDSSAEQTLKRILSQVDAKNLVSVLESVRKRRDKIDVSPAYGNEVVSISKQILAFGGAGVALAAAFVDRITLLPSAYIQAISLAGLFYLNLVLLSLWILFLFTWQARFRYPFLYLQKIGNAKPYFYYSAVSKNTPRGFFQTRNQKIKALELYKEDLIGFVQYLVNPFITGKEVKEDTLNGSQAEAEPAEDTSNTRSLEQELRDELQQYFLLLAYQGYVNQFEVQINNTFIYGFLSSVAATTVMALVLVFFMG